MLTLIWFEWKHQKLIKPCWSCEGRSKVPIPSNPVYGDLDNLTTNQKAWLNWDLFTPLFMGDEKGMTIPFVNFLDNPAALR